MTNTDRLSAKMDELRVLQDAARAEAHILDDTLAILDSCFFKTISSRSRANCANW
jgi:hypothetical protein